MANNEFNIDDYLPKATTQDNSLQPKPQSTAFNIDDYLGVQGNDVTGLGEKQAVDFATQLANFPSASPVQQYMAFEQYGNQYKDHLTQKGYSGDQIAQMLAEFSTKADPRNQTGKFEYYGGDFGNDVMIGTGNLVGDALAAVPESIPVIGSLADQAEKYVKDTTKAWENDKSARSQIQTYLGNRAEQQALANGASEISALMANLGENPMQIASLLTQQAPQLLLGGMGKAALTGVNVAGGAGRVRSDIEEAYETTAKENPSQLLQLPEIKDRMANGMSFEEAVNDAKTDITDNWKSIAAGAAIGGTEALSPLGKFGQGVNRGVLKTLGKEVGQEAFQEGAEQLNSNLAVGSIDGKTQVFDNVIRNSTLGGIAGLGTGIPTAIEAGLNKNNPTPQQESDQSIDTLMGEAENEQHPTQEQSTSQENITQGQPVNNSVLESILSGYKENEQQYKEIYKELESDINDGLIAQRANDNTEYGRLARAYLAQTGQEVTLQQAVETPQTFANQPIQAELQQSANVAQTQPSVEVDNEADVTNLDPNVETENNPQQTLQNGTRYSLNESNDSDFIRSIEDISSGKRKGRDDRYLNMGTTPDVFKMIGLPDTKVSMRESVIDKVTQGKHKIDIDDFKQLPNQINNPIAVTKSRTRPNGYVVLTELNENVDGVKKPVIAALHLNKTNNGLEVVNIVSSYGRNISQLNEDIKESLYWNKTKGYPFARTVGLQLPSSLASVDNLSAKNIKTETDLSQYQSGKNTATPNQIEQDQATLSRILGEKTASHIQVVDRNTPIPTGQNVKKLAANGVEGGFDVSAQKLYIISDNITANEVLSRDERLAWVAFHELSHAGVRIKYGPILTNVLASAGKNVVVKVLARKIQTEHGYTQEVAIEEAMAEIYAAFETGNWAELESRYNTKIHHSYKQGKDSLGDFLTKIANLLRRLMGAIVGKDLTQTMTTSQVFDTLRGIQQGVNEITNTEQNQTAGDESNRYSQADRSAYEQAKANGETELTFEQYNQVRTPEFKAWFGDWENDPENASKVINPKTGEPLVVYHGTNAEFTIFDRKKIGSATDYGIRGKGFYFSPNKNLVSINYGSNVMDTFLSIRNPFDPFKFTSQEELAKYLGVDENIFTFTPNAEFKVYSSYSGVLSEVLRNKGYDGVSYPRRIEFVAFDSNQIKSATDNNGEFSADNEDIRYSIKQSVADLAKTGKAKADQTFIDELKTKDYNGFKKRFDKAVGKLDEWIADGLRPVNDWIDETLKGSGVSDHEAERLKDDMYRAKGVRDALNSELEQAYLKPLLKKVAEVAKANKLDELSAKRLIGYWASTRYAIEKNNEILSREHQEMLDAEKALNDAKAKGEDIESLSTEYRKAERQYRYRKHDVELALNSDEEFKVGTAGGWSNAEAQHIMENIEKHIPRKELELAVSYLYALNQRRLEIDHKAGRYTEEQYKEFRKNRHYVPLTGDPNADENFDGISGAGQNAVNVSKDRALKGRKLSEAEDGIDASWRGINNSTTYAGWVDFKNSIDDIFENTVSELVEKGHSERSAREQAEKTLGISKQRMQGTTRSSDDVLIRKVGGIYYEYKLPQEVITALKNDNVENANAFLKVLSTPTSWYARGVTQWTITFAPMNMLRDTWEKSEFIRVQKLYDKEGNLLDDKTMNKIGRAVLKNAFYNKGTWKATKRMGFNQELRNEGDEKLLKRLLELGGVSTYSTYLARTETDLVKKVKSENSALGKRLEQAGSALESYNKVFDTVSALAAFKAMLDHGVDEKQAAAKTLELTNFRKTGSKMRGIKALYMFSQPTAMGARNLIKYLATPKGRHRFFGYMAVMMPLYLALRAMDDEDEGGNVMDQLGDITRYIPLPIGDGKYLKIPVGFGMPQMAWNFSVNMAKAGAGDISFTEASINMLVHSMKTFAPVSPSEISAAKYPLEKLTLTATPTILQPLMQNVLNRSAFGSKITTNFVSEGKLKSEQSKSTTAQFWKDLVVGVNDTLGIDMHPEQIKNLFDGYGAMLGSLRELQTIFIENPNREQLGRRTRTPFLNQFIGTTNEFSIQSRYYEASEEAITFSKRYESRKERGIVDELSPQERAMLNWHNLNEKRMQELRSEKAKHTKALREKKINANIYEARIKAYNEKMDKTQRVFLKRWREMQGLNTH